MAYARRVWLSSSPEPAEGSPSDLPAGSHPPHWLEEDPRYAAELYALERRIPAGHVGEYSMEVCVRDVEGALTRWRVRLIPTVEVSVKPLPA